MHSYPQSPAARGNPLLSLFQRQSLLAVADGKNRDALPLNAVDHAIVLENDFSDVRTLHLGDDSPRIWKTLKPLHGAENVEQENSSRFNVVLGNIVRYFVDSLELERRP